MAVDKKSDHVGNHGGTYTDIDGASRQFTYIDHDRHTTRTQSGREDKDYLAQKEDEKKRLHEKVMESRRRSIEEILCMPAVKFLESGNLFAEDCIIRDPEKGIIWDETYVKNFLDVRPDMIYTMANTLWKHTVKEQHWFTELTHEDMMAGKWKELM
jgi:hypothetical protein